MCWTVKDMEVFEKNEEGDSEEESVGITNLPLEEPMPIFGNPKEYLASPFEEIHDEFLE